MKPAPFEYHLPRSIEEMTDMLSRYGEEGRILSGGQSLVPAMNFRLSRPEHIIDINKLKELDWLETTEDRLRIGSLVRHVVFEKSVTDDVLGQLLADVARYIAHWPIRVRRTFAGSLAHADPASEWCLVAVTLDAEIIVLGPRGKRSVSASEFFLGGFRTAVANDEAIVEVNLPLLGRGASFGFAEFSRRTGDFALAMSLSVIWLDESGLIERALVGIGGVESRPVRVHDAETALRGEAPSSRLFDQIAEIVAENLKPIEDIHADAEFRLDLSQSMTRKALEGAIPK